MIRRWVGIALVGLCLVAALLGPLLVRDDPYRQDLGQALAPPSAAHPLGTDPLGRSVLARLFWGARESLMLASVAVAVYVVAGLGMGMTAGLAGGWADVVIMRLCDGLLAFPGILLALVVAGFLGGGRWTLVAALALTGWCDFCRLSRNLALRVLAEDYVRAARLLGFGPWQLARLYLLPELWPHLRNLGSLTLGQTILNLSAFGFLGIGLTPPLAEWGGMISQGLPYLEEAPGLVLWPGAAICLTVLGCNLLATKGGGHA